MQFCNPAILQNNARSRKPFCRYKANAQRAARDGDYKFLKILDSTFLFNVVDDPMERANLKERRKHITSGSSRTGTPGTPAYCPEVDESQTGGFTGDQLADHIGAKRATTTADNPK